MTWLQWCIIVANSLNLLNGLRLVAQHIIQRKYDDVYLTNEFYDACHAVDAWYFEGKITKHNKQTTYTTLVRLARGDVNRLRAICGPNGFAVYKMLLAQQKWWH